MQLVFLPTARWKIRFWELTRLHSALYNVLCRLFLLLWLLILQVTSLKNLGLNIRKAALKQGSKASKLYITDANTSEKILKSSRLEEIRMTVINNMLFYHPVSNRHLHVN